jgi:hypothetical protein
MRYVWIVSGAGLCIALLIVAIGYALPVKHRAVGESTLNASPGAVFSLITNVDSFPSWRPGITQAGTLPSLDGGKRFREVSRFGTITYVVYNPVFRFVSRFVTGHNGTINEYLSAVQRKFPG